jgi:hypothetical protein
VGRGLRGFPHADAINERGDIVGESVAPMGAFALLHFENAPFAGDALSRSESRRVDQGGVSGLFVFMSSPLVGAENSDSALSASWSADG